MDKIDEVRLKKDLEPIIEAFGELRKLYEAQFSEDELKGDDSDLTIREQERLQEARDFLGFKREPQLKRGKKWYVSKAEIGCKYEAADMAKVMHESWTKQGCGIYPDWMLRQADPIKLFGAIMKQMKEGRTLYMAHEKHNTIGFVVLTPPNGIDVFVVSEHKGKGIEQGLMQKAIAEYKRRGVAEVYFSCHEKNINEQELFKSLGAENISRGDETDKDAKFGMPMARFKLTI